LWKGFGTDVVGGAKSGLSLTAEWLVKPLPQDIC
jgi:hypothetical protein